MGTILSSYGHAIAIRHDLLPGEGNSYMRTVAEHANVPVLNMQCDIDHPFQTLADLMTIREEFGKNLRGLKIAVSWAYAPSYAKPMSVPQGLITLMTRFGLDVTLAHPPEYALMKGPMAYAREMAKANGTKFEVVDSMDDAVRDADIVYPEIVGDRVPVQEPAGSPRDLKEIQELDIRRAPDGPGVEGGDLHALSPRRQGVRGDRRGDRRSALARVPGSREPAPYVQIGYGAHDVTGETTA